MRSPSLVDGGFLQAVESLQPIYPFDDEAVAPAQISELLPQHHGEEGVEQMVANGGVRGLID